jgi:IS5 family transposase
MKQMTFADAEYADKRKQARKELFLIEMHQVGPWKGCRLFLVCLG